MNPDDLVQLDKMINPHDMLFVVGQNKKATCEMNFKCMGEEEEEEEMDLVATCGGPADFDLSKYRNTNGRLIQTPSLLDNCVNADCCELKVCTRVIQKFRKSGNTIYIFNS